ncbi:hypothetical protein RclHR1_11230012 [Rhizophagus clarus]|uniref:Uncharacterized protein n=1 Tax=Rhizophagus clarus TaxID=94130 RepID=A0A2Z6QFY6_9GLOM|nr:hypothetical protein RclHR1_11230012 [Rhizophagus clarus]
MTQIIKIPIIKGCIILYRIIDTKYKEAIKREIKFLITTFNEYDYARHVHWRIIRELNDRKPTFSVIFLSKYEEFLTIDIVDNLYIYYNVSSRSNSIDLLNENLYIASPPPVYSLSFNSTFNLSNTTHNTTINIPENSQSIIIDQQSITNDNRRHVFPSFLSNIPPPPPPPTYQEALDGDRVLFVEGSNDQYYFGMGRSGSVIRGWL